MSDSAPVVTPATHTVHWPSRPVDCCERHARELVALGNFMGGHIAVTTCKPGEVCSNCLNESKEIP